MVSALIVQKSCMGNIIRKKNEPPDTAPDPAYSNIFSA